MSPRTAANNPRSVGARRAAAGTARVALRVAIALLLVAAPLAPAPAAAQPPAPPPRADSTAARSASGWGELHRFASDSADRLRQAQLRGAATGGFLLRSASSMTAPVELAEGRAAAWRPLLPAVTTVLNSAVPLSMNDGPLWSGVGANLRVLAALEARWGRLRLIAAPELLVVGNAHFELADTGTTLAPSIPGDRSPYSSPWHQLPSSIDLPLRFGDGRVRRLDPGQSSLTLALGALELGAATENQWWGPTIQNALLLSDNAGGFPHLFLRTARPLATPVGALELRYLLGGLSESAYFDTLSANDRRSYSALAVTLQPRGADGLTVGLARAVYASVDGWGGVFGRALDPFANVPDPGAVAAGATASGTREQILSVFSRLVLPASGFEAYAELARSAFPRSLRDLLVSPAHSRGHTFGVQWLGEPLRDDARLRLQAEYTNVERSPSRLYRTVGSFYTSARVPQGYTQRGQSLGAAIGPGSSSQWLAADLVQRDWSGGLVLTRVRWNNDAHNERPWNLDEGWCEHDVSLIPGVRGSARSRYGVFNGRILLGKRINTFFDNGGYCPKGLQPRDESNAQIMLSFQPTW